MMVEIKGDEIEDEEEEKKKGQKVDPNEWKKKINSYFAWVTLGPVCLYYNTHELNINYFFIKCVSVKE